MLHFNDPFKIYLFKHTEEVKLSIKVSSHVVDTYAMPQLVFENLLAACCDAQGASVKGSAVSWWAQHKHIGKTTEYVRLSAWYAGASRDYRTDRYIIDLLCKEYDKQKNTTMYWDKP